MKKAKVDELAGEEKRILDGLSEKEQKSYLTKSLFTFISLHISMFIIGFWWLFIDVYQVFILKEPGSGIYRYKYRFWSVFIIPMAVVYLIKYLKKSKEKKILDFYEILHKDKIKDKKIKALLWFSEICVIAFTVALPLYHLIDQKKANITLILITIAGVIFSIFLWFAALRRKKEKKTKDKKQ